MEPESTLVHELLKADRLAEAVEWVLSERMDSLRQYEPVLHGLQGCDPRSDRQSAAFYLAAYLLLTGDHAGARLAFETYVDTDRSKCIVTCTWVADPATCFDFEPPARLGGRTFALHQMTIPPRKSEDVPTDQTRGPAAVARIPGGSVLGLSFIPMSRNATACLDWFVHHRLNLNKVMNSENSRTLPLVTPNALLACFDGTDEYDEGILIGNCDNFGHWLLNHLARLALVMPDGKFEGIPLVVGENISGTQLDCLARFGFDRSKLIQLRQGRLARFKMLWAPVMPFCALDNSLWWSPYIVDFLRSQFRLRPPDSGPRRRLFVSRRNSRWRRLSNEDELRPYLVGLRFEFVDPGSLTIAQQIDLASNAEIIMGPTGAGMNILIFAPGDAVVIDLTHLGGEMALTYPICSQIGQRYIKVEGTREANDDDPLKHDISVTRRQITEALRIAGVQA